MSIGQGSFCECAEKARWKLNQVYLRLFLKGQQLMQIEIEFLAHDDREEIAEVQIGDSTEFEGIRNFSFIFGSIGKRFFSR